MTTYRLKNPLSPARRRLLAAATEGAILAGLSLAAGPLRAQPPARTAPTVVDVLVIGSGAAGLSAAVAAREAGAPNVLLLEKGPLIGGHTLYSSGSIAAVSPKRTRATGTDDSIEQFVADALVVGGNHGSAAHLREIALGSESALDWLESMGVRFGAPFIAYSEVRPRSYAMPGNGAGRNYILALARRAGEIGVQIEMNARAVSLERARTGSGWCVEVGATQLQPQMGRKTEALRKIRARTVVIATGGFTANVARRERINPLVGADVHTSANPYGRVWDGADGDGIDLALSAGGIFMEGYGLQLLPFWGGRLLDYVGGDIYVNLEGKRFVNEALSWGRIAEAILRLPEKRFWVITDAQSYKGATLGIKLLNGIVKKSETIAEMADGMGIPAQTLERTINEYNRCVRDGFDPVFRKDVFAQEIKKPPFYWGEEHIYVHTSFDGIATDPRGSVVYKDGRPIPGLFAAGEVVGGIFGRDRLGGGSLANCFVIGRLTGERAAQAARLVAAKEEAMRTRLGG